MTYWSTDDDGVRAIRSTWPHRRVALMADFIEYGHVEVNSLSDAQYVAVEAADMGDDWPVIRHLGPGRWSVTARSQAGPSRQDARKRRPGLRRPLKVLLWCGAGAGLWAITFYLLPIEAAVAVVAVIVLGVAFMIWIDMLGDDLPGSK